MNTCNNSMTQINKYLNINTTTTHTSAVQCSAVGGGDDSTPSTSILLVTSCELWTFHDSICEFYSLDLSSLPPKQPFAALDTPPSIRPSIPLYVCLFVYLFDVLPTSALFCSSNVTLLTRLKPFHLVLALFHA
jgi:hypothetical protein